MRQLQTDFLIKLYFQGAGKNCRRTGQFPQLFKQCRVIPIFKAGDPLECDNYRPISLLSSISKVLEKIVAEKLVYHLNSNDLLYQHQYGFMAKNPLSKI